MPETARSEGVDMHKHTHFDLAIHDDLELAAHIGGEILARETLHEWPLSCVERVTTQQGQWIYKSQFGPTAATASSTGSAPFLAQPSWILPR